MYKEEIMVMWWFVCKTLVTSLKARSQSITIDWKPKSSPVVSEWNATKSHSYTKLTGDLHVGPIYTDRKKCVWRVVWMTQWLNSKISCKYWININFVFCISFRREVFGYVSQPWFLFVLVATGNDAQWTCDILFYNFFSFKLYTYGTSIEQLFYNRCMVFLDWRGL